MIYLTDNDILEKLARCDLLDDAAAAYRAARRDVFVLPSFKFRLGIPKGGPQRTKAEKRIGVEAVARVADFLKSVQEVSEVSDPDQQVFDDIVGVDPGEAILLAAAANRPESRLCTGDKRCLRTIAFDPACKLIALIASKDASFALNKSSVALSIISVSPTSWGRLRRT